MSIKRPALTFAGLCAIACASTAQADTLLGVYAGAQGWNMDTSGSFADESAFADGASSQDFGFDSETQGSVYIAFEHFVPLVPNVKVQHTQFDTQGLVQLSASFSFGDELYTVDSNVQSSVDMTATDIILYYELFDNDLVSFDVGINGKWIDGDLFLRETDSQTESEESFSGVIPMLYSRVGIGLPFTGLGVYAEGSFLAIDDSTISDVQVALTYSFIESLALDMTLQLGYRDVTVELDDIDDISSDLSFDGVFAGIELHF